MTTFGSQSRAVAKIIDAGRKGGHANIAGNTPDEIKASLMKSLAESTTSVPAIKSPSPVKGSHSANHKKA